MDMDDLSAEKWAEQIKAVCPVDITEQLAAYRKAVVEACRKECSNRRGLYGHDYDAACTEIEQAIAGVGCEK